MQRLSLRDRNMRFSGKIIRAPSLLTGNLVTYHETYHIQVGTPATNPQAISELINRINTDLLDQGVDGFCNHILMIQGVTQSIYKPRVWIAEEQPVLMEKTPPKLIVWGPIIIAICKMIMILAVAIAAVLICSMLTSSFTTIARYILQPPSYVGGDPENPEVYDNWAQYLSSQHLHYWYVCPKCGAGFGAKTAYPNITDVPQEEVEAYNEHVKSCLGIPQGSQNVWEFLIWTAAIIGGSVIIIVAIGQLGQKAAPMIMREYT